MKKVILGMVFIAVAMTAIDSNATEPEMEQDCLNAAWEYGTMMGNGNSYLEWYYTDLFVTEVCER